MVKAPSRRWPRSLAFATAVAFVVVQALWARPADAQRRGARAEPGPPAMRVGASIGLATGDSEGDAAGGRFGVHAAWALAPALELELGFAASVHPTAHPPRSATAFELLGLYRLDVSRVTPYLGVGFGIERARQFDGNAPRPPRFVTALVVGATWWQRGGLGVGGRVRWTQVGGDPLDRAFPAYALAELVLDGGW